MADEKIDEVSEELTSEDALRARNNELARSYDEQAQLIAKLTAERDHALERAERAEQRNDAEREAEQARAAKRTSSKKS